MSHGLIFLMQAYKAPLQGGIPPAPLCLPDISMTKKRGAPKIIFLEQEDILLIWGIVIQNQVLSSRK